MTLATRQAIQALNDLGIMLDSSLADKPITTHAAVTTLFDLLEEDFLPQPTLYEKDFARFQHMDLSALDSQALWKETRRAEFLVIWCEDHKGWLAERLAACLAESKRREGKKAKG